MEALTRALQRRLTVDPPEAKGLAFRILNYFGYSGSIIDNMVDQEDRKLFYQLHDAGILRTSWETTLLLNGKSWRIFYWRLNLEEIRRAGEDRDEEEAEPVYDSLPSEAWSHATAT